MAGLGIGVFFVGYSVFYYGLSQVTGHNYGFLDVVVPSRWAAAEASPPPTDGPSLTNKKPNPTGTAGQLRNAVTGQTSKTGVLGQIGNTLSFPLRVLGL